MFLEGYSGDRYLNHGWADWVRTILGGIDLDAASDHVANTAIKARRYFTLDDDALSCDWDAKDQSVYLSAPGDGRARTTLLWWRKWLAETECSRAACWVAYNRDQCRWMEPCIYSIPLLLVEPRVRVEFWNGQHDGGSPPMHAVFLFRGIDLEDIPRDRHVVCSHTAHYRVFRPPTDSEYEF